MFEQDVPKTATGNVLEDMAALVAKIREQTATVQRITAELTLAQSALNNLTLTVVPEAMQAAGLTELRLDDGARLIVKSDLKVNIAEANAAAAYAWLRSAGHEMAIRQVLEVDLRALPASERESMLSTLDKKYHAEPVVKENIHNATLKSIISHSLESGVTVPPCIGVHQFSRASLT